MAQHAIAMVVVVKYKATFAARSPHRCTRKLGSIRPLDEVNAPFVVVGVTANTIIAAAVIIVIEPHVLESM